MSHNFKSNDTRNPFTLPNDEEVFRLRDEEKRQRAEARDKNMKLKIWQKGKHGALAGRSLRVNEMMGDTGDGPSGKKVSKGVLLRGLGLERWGGGYPVIDIDECGLCDCRKPLLVS